MSGYGEPSGMQPQGARFLHKPFSIKTLLDAVRECAAEPEAHDLSN
jgi:hypothetical protein